MIILQDSKEANSDEDTKSNKIKQEMPRSLVGLKEFM